MTLEDRKQAAHILLDAALLKAVQLETLRREVRDLEAGVTLWNAKETRKRVVFREARIAELEEERDNLTGWLESILDGDTPDGLDDVIHEAKCLLAYHQRTKDD